MTLDVQDRFDGTNASLTSRTPQIGGTWVKLEDTTGGAVDLETVSGRLGPNGTATSDRILYTNDATIGTADTVSELRTRFFTAADADDPHWLLARVQDSSNYYVAGTYVAAATSDKVIGKKTGGTYTELGTADTGLSDNDKIRFQVQGTALDLFHDTESGFAAAVISVTDSDHSAAGNNGLAYGNIAVSTDDIHTDWQHDEYDVFSLTDDSIVFDTFSRRNVPAFTNHTSNFGRSWSLLEDTTGGPSLFDFLNETSTGAENSRSSDRILYTNDAILPSADTANDLTLPTLATTGDDPVWLLARVQDVNNYYAGGTYISAGLADKVIGKKTTSTYTELGTADTGLAANDKIRFQVSGTSLSLFQDTGSGFGSAIISTTDSDHAAAGSSGLAKGNIAVALDDISATWALDNFEVTQAMIAAPTGPPRPSGAPFIFT